MLLAANRLPQLSTVGVSSSANLEEISIANFFWRESCYEHGGGLSLHGRAQQQTDDLDIPLTAGKLER